MTSSLSDAEPPAARLSRAFGQAVRQHRANLGLSQKDLALSLGVGERFIVDLEAGKPTCQMGKAFAAARAVGIDIASLLGAAEDTAPSSPQGYDLPVLPSPRKAPR